MSRSEESASELSLIVGVGASAGGLQAFRELIASIPEENEFTFILAQHFEPEKKSSLAQILAKESPLLIEEAFDGQPLRPGCIYVVPAGVTPRVEKGRLHLAPFEERGHSFSILDELFSSLAAAYGPRAAVVVLSGTGADGARGVRELRLAGGLPIVQTPETAQYEGMPQNVASLGGADLILPIPEIYDALKRFAKLPLEYRYPDFNGAHKPAFFEESESAGESEAESESKIPGDVDLKQLARVLRRSSNFDLEGYKKGTILRRISRRMSLNGIQDFDELLQVLRDDPRARHQLLDDLLISVTDFFRGASSFAALQSDVIEPLIQSLSSGQTMRVWVAGCATGEEAYSIAMLILEAIEAHRAKEIKVQIFATDIDEASLAVARRGVYSLEAAESIGQARLQAFFHQEEGQLRVSSRLRDIVNFARHDVVVDPPFSRMHLVSCRNLLIYLKPQRQNRVLERLHFSLQPGGYLFLGSSETVARKSTLFSPVQATAHIYKKVGISSPIHQSAPDYPPIDLQILERTDDTVRRKRLETIQAQQALLKALAPASVVVSAADEILYTQGNLSPFLQFPQGHPNLELFHLIEPTLQPTLRTLLNRCRRQNEPVELVVRNSQLLDAPICLQAQPAPDLGKDAVILSFRLLKTKKGEEGDRGHRYSPDEESLVKQLEQELSDTRDELRMTVAQLEISNEDLRAVHEESLSMNEELQAANEELEATSEELRLLNEELVSVNGVLREKVGLLEEANHALSNFFSSSRLATIFVDRELRVVRMTPAAQRLFGLSDSLLGHTLEEVDNILLQENLLHEVEEVLEQLTPQSRELEHGDGRWFTRQILPYRTEDEQILGVVITFVEVTELKRAAEEISAREHQQAAIARLGLQSLDEMDLQRFMDQVVREIRRTLDVDICTILEAKPDSQRLLLRAGAGTLEGLVGHSTVSSELGGQAGFTLRSHYPVFVEELSQEPRFEPSAFLKKHQLVSSLGCSIRNADGVYGVLEVHTRKKRLFSDHDANFLQSMAALVAAGVSRHYQQLRSKIEAETGRVIATAADIQDAMAQIHSVFFNHLDLAIGEYWAQDPKSLEWNRLVLTVNEERARSDAPALIEEAEHLGTALIDRIMESNQPQWMTTFEGAPDPLKTSSDGEPLLPSGLVVPVLMHGKTKGALLFYSRKRLIVDPSFSEGLLTLSRTLGEFVLRSRAEEERRQNAARFTEIFETVDVGLLEEDYTPIFRELAALKDQGIQSAEELQSYLEQNTHYTSELIKSVRVLNANEAALRLLDAQEKTDVQGLLHQIFIPESRDNFIKGLCALFANKTGFSTESRIRTLKGRLLDIKLTLRFPRPEQKHHRVLSSFVDITDNKRYQAELQMASDQKDRFLAMLGHELRNPLAAVYMATQTLGLIDIEDETLTQVRQILERQTGHMSRLLDGLLDVSRVVRGKITLKEEVLDLREVIQDVLQDLQLIIKNSGLRVGHDLPEEPLYIKGDRVRLTQITDNLLSNAVKYTSPPGVVIISARQEGDEIVMVVEDSGIGIEKELLPHIFDTFRQSKQSIDRSAGGLGLGLSLIKELVELHGGEVTAESEGENQGARFTVRLPRAVEEPKQPEPEGNGEYHPKRVLIIEDNPDIADSMARLLEIRGAQVAVAYDGPQGLEEAKDFAPDLILCDIGLPGGMSGFDVARSLREQDQFKHTRLIAITGYGRREDQERSLEAGFDQHLTKPVDFKALQQLLE